MEEPIHTNFSVVQVAVSNLPPVTAVIPVGGTLDFDINVSQPGRSITLTLSTLPGTTGSALFAANNSNSLVITGSIVTLAGIQKSSEPYNILLEIAVDGEL